METTPEVLVDTPDTLRFFCPKWDRTFTFVYQKWEEVFPFTAQLPKEQIEDLSNLKKQFEVFAETIFFVSC